MKYQKIIEQMTLEEKASLTSGHDFWQTQDIERFGIPKMFLADGPHGVRKQAAAADHLGLNESIKATCYPPAVSLANTWNTELVEKVGQALGKEVVSQKVNVLLGPGTNIKRNPLCGRNFEYYSEDPYLSGKMASAQIRGIQSNGISACVKHFAANNQEERRLVIDSVIDERTLREIYLTPFEMAVKEGKVSTLMSAYNKVNGTFANENMHLLRTILREDWGFEGLIVTDWGGNNDRINGLIAGNDLEMPGNGGDTDREIIEAINNKSLDEKYLDEAVNRILSINESTAQAINNYQKDVDLEKNHQVAYEAAQEAIILLQNKNNILPLNEKDKVCIIGEFAENPRYQGAGSSLVNPTKLDITLDFIDKYPLNYIGYVKGFKRYGKKSKKLLKEAIKLAEKSDVIILYLGLDEITEVEGLDRLNMNLPKNQLTLVDELSELGKKIVVVLSSGSAIEIPFTDKVDGIIHGYLLGQSNAKAILDVITGKVNPSGRLSETIPFDYEDIPSAPYFPGKELTVEYREGLYVGYRYFDKVDMDVLYPFGFGLSYTTFSYNDLIITDNGITLNVTNTGNYDGSEVVQLYIGLDNSNLYRVKKELKGFKKVFLKKGETKQVHIPFDEYTFRYFDVEKDNYLIEEGTYQIYVGKNVNEIVLTGEIKVNGVKTYRNEMIPSYYSGDIKSIQLEEFENLLKHKAPDSKRKYIKKNRILVDYNTTVAELRYAKGWTGRLFAWGITVIPKILKFFGKKQLSNTIYMGMYHQPMRGISRMTNGMINWEQLKGLLIMFNGKFFRGFKTFIKAGRNKRRRLKAQR